jgi:hypothetical protein
MPYYVFAVKAFGLLDKLAEFDAFKDASAHAKLLRTRAGPDTRIKVMFGDNQLHAEDLLSQRREAMPSGPDD